MTNGYGKKAKSAYAIASVGKLIAFLYEVAAIATLVGAVVLAANGWPQPVLIVSSVLLYIYLLSKAKLLSNRAGKVLEEAVIEDAFEDLIESIHKIGKSKPRSTLRENIGNPFAGPIGFDQGT